MDVFGLEVTSTVVEAIAAHAEAAYPIEACGLVLGRPTVAALDRVVPMANVQDRYHRLDPVAFPRDGRDAFRLDELERMRVLEAAEAEGLVERVLYHSHCDAGAYFSPEDRAMAVREGVELLPGIIHLVVSVREGRRFDLAAYRYEASRGIFEELRVPLGPELDGTKRLPDLARRSMEGRESARPIRPVGGALMLRKLAAGELEALLPLAEERTIELDALRAAEARAFASGFFSPLSGYLEARECRSIEQEGRLRSGTPWRTPLVLEVPRSAVRGEVAPGCVVRLVEPGGFTLGLLAVFEVLELAGGSLTFAGAIFVEPEACKEPDAAERRAALARRGARRALAVPPDLCERLAEEDLAEFDVILAARPVEKVETQSLAWSPTSFWLGAAMAQNQGATHLWVEDPELRRVLKESLDIEPWPARVKS